MNLKMKNRYLFSAITLLSLFLLSTSLYALEDCYHNVDESEKENSRFAVSSGENIFVAGEVFSISNKKDIFIKVYNENFELVKTTVFGKPFDDEIRDFKITKNGDLLLLSRSLTDAKNNGVTIVKELDYNLNEISQIEIDDDVMGDPLRVLKDNDEGYLLAGSIGYEAPHGIMKVDSKGTVLWSKVLTEMTLFPQMDILTNEGNILVAGSIASLDGCAGGEGGVLICENDTRVKEYDSSLNMIWEMAIPVKSFMGSSQRFIGLSDSFVYSSSYYDFSSYSGKGVISEIFIINNGKIVFSNKNQGTIFNLLKGTNGSIIVTSYKEPKQSSDYILTIYNYGDAYISAYDKNLALLWETPIRKEKKARSTIVGTVIYGDSYIAIGKTMFDNDRTRSTWFAKIDVDGNLVCEK